MNLSQTVPNSTERTETTESEDISPADPSPSGLNWKQERARQWWGIKLWERAAMVNKLDRQNGIVHRLARKQQDGTLGLRTEEPEDAGDDDLGTHIGDTTETHHHYPPPQNNSGTSALSKLAVAGIAATGLGLPVGGALALPSLLEALNGTPRQAAPVVPSDKATDKAPDNDTLFELRGRRK